MITVATWNVNSIKVRRDAVSDWLEKHRPDFLMLQEIKCKTESFPAAHFEELGYHSAVVGQAAYNGVATLSRHKVVTHNIILDKNDPLARFVEVIWEDKHIINIYAPNGNPIGTEKFAYKLRWLDELHDYLGRLLKQRKKFVIGGDFNIIPEDLDAARPHKWLTDALFQPEARAQWRRLLNLGLVDAYRALHPKKQEYTFWDYFRNAFERNDGIRIDHFLLSPYFADRLTKCAIDTEPRMGERPSDHTPIIATFKL